MLRGSIEPVDSELTFKAISCGLVLLIWLTTVALLWISMTKEWRLGQPIMGGFELIVAALCLCAFIVLVVAYVQKTLACALLLLIFILGYRQPSLAKRALILTVVYTSLAVMSLWEILR
jgi:glucan phosphoethanolaminetransferase (alkaline phosphatase superfamily)